MLSEEIRQLSVINTQTCMLFNVVSQCRAPKFKKNTTAAVSAAAAVMMIMDT